MITNQPLVSAESIAGVCRIHSLMFRTKTRTRLILATALAGWSAVLSPLSSSAAAITWGNAANINDDTDVFTNGAALYSYAGGITTASTNVNGVTFTAGSGFASWGSVSFTSGFGGSTTTAFGLAAAPFSSLSGAYQAVLQGGAYGNVSAGTVTLNGLTMGEAYGLQIWVNDSRSTFATRQESVGSSNGNSTALQYNFYQAAGGVGQYVVGTFVSDSASQTFNLTNLVGGPEIQINAISVRDLGGPIKTWLGTGGTSWGTAGNWNPSGAPIPGQSVAFNSLSTASLATVPDQAYTLATLTLSNAPSAVSIGSSGFTLTVNNGINLFGSGQNLAINDPLVLGASQTWTVTNSDSVLAVNGGISGSAGLTITGGGTVSMSAAATYTGNTIINAGDLILSGAGSVASSSLTVAGGATLDVSAESPTFVLNGRILKSSSGGAVMNGANDCTSGDVLMVFDGVHPCFIQTNGTMTLSSASVVTVNIPGSLLSAGTYTVIAAATAGNVGHVAVSDFLPAVTVSGNGAVGAASLQIDGSGNLNLVIATPDVWTGASDGNWSNGANWTPASEPNPADSILFNNLSTANLNIAQNDTAAGGVILGLSLINPAGPVTIGGPGNLTVYSGGLNLSMAAQDLTVSSPLILNANQNWIVTNSRNLIISGPVSSVSGGNVTVTGGGKVKMGAAHVLDGLTNLTSNLGDFNVNGSTLDLNGNSQAMNGLNGNASAIVDNTASGAATLAIGGNNDASTFNGIIENSGAGSLGLQVNGGNLTLSGSNSYSGGTIFNTGATLNFPSANRLGTGPITFNPGSSIYSFAVTFTNALSLNGGYLHLGGNYSGDNQIWSGPITMTTNGVTLSSDNPICQLILAGPVNIGSMGTTVTNFGNAGLGGAGTASDTISGQISGSGSLTYVLNGSLSRLTVTGANLYTGGTVINGTGGKLDVYGGNYGFGFGPVTLNPGGIIEAYPGSATITNALTLNGGVLYTESQFNNYNQLNWAGPITMTADSALFEWGANNSQQSAGVVLSGPVNNTGYTLTCGGTSTLYVGHSINGPISGSGTIQVTNLNLTISGTNTFGGTFRSVGGTLIVNNVYALQNATLDMNAADAGAVNLNNNNAIIGALTGSRNLNLGGGSVSIGNNNSSTTYGGTLSGGGSLTKIGTGTLILSGTNSYSGNTTVMAGTLDLQQPTLTFGSTVTVAAGAVLELDFSTTNVVTALVLNGVSKPNGLYNSGNSGGFITGAGSIQVGVVPNIWTGALSSEWSTNILTSPFNWKYNSTAGNYTDGSAVLFDDTLTANNSVNVSLANVLPVGVTFNNNKTNYFLTGSFGIAGTASLIKNGTNTVTILNPNAYTGNTFINGGTLTIGVGGSLGATYAGAITLANNSTFEYGNNANATLSGAITGIGGLLFDSSTACTLTLSGINTYTGPTIISNALNAGIKLSAAFASIPAGSTFTILGNATSGGQLYVSSPGTLPNNFNISGIGYHDYNYYGAIKLANGVNLSGSINLLGNAEIGAETPSSGASTISGQITGNAGISFLGGFDSSSTVGTQTFILANTNTATPNNYTGATTINNAYGTAGFTTTTTTILQLGADNQIPSGTGYGLLTFNNGNNANRGVAFELNGHNQTINGTVVANGADTFIRNTAVGASTLTIGAGNTSSTFSGRISDGGTGKTLAITKIGTGTLTLSGTSFYNGVTIVNGGVLLVNASNGTGTNAVIINNGGTLGGTGSILGPVTNYAGGILSPGVSGLGKLTLSGNVMLMVGSTNTFVVNGTTPTNNSIVLGAAITYGGVLNIATNGNFTLGQKFMLFSGAGATNTSNFSSVAGNPGVGLAFSFTNGILSVVAAPSGPTLTSVTPNPVTGSSYPVSLSLAGSGFTGASAVLLTNLTAASGASYTPTVNSDTSISVRFVPGTASSSWNATVVNGSVSSQVGFAVTVPAKVNINTASLNSAGPGKLVLSGGGGVANDSYAVLSATNLSVPVLWTPVVTNQFDNSGNFSYTNLVNPATPQLFLRVQQ